MSTPFGRDTAPPSPSQKLSAPAAPTIGAARANVGHQGAGQTPQSRGGVVRGKYDEGRLKPLKYKCADYDDFLKLDMKNRRIYMDIDTFSERILRIPYPQAHTVEFGTEDASLNAVVDKVFDDATFKSRLQAFLGKCREAASVEHQLYSLHAAMNDRAMEIAEEAYPGHDTIRFYRNDPTTLKGGILNKHNITPDMLALLLSLFESSGNDAVQTQHRGPLYNFFWCMVLFILEGKDVDCTVWDARDGYRLLDAVTKKDPIDITAPEPLQKRKPRAPSRLAHPSAQTKSQATAPKRKRKMVGSATIQSPSKRPRSLPPIHEDSERYEDITIPSLPVKREDEPIPDEMAEAHEQCTRYGLEMLTVPALRDSCVMHFFDRNRIQLMYFSHNLMITSTAIDLEIEAGVKRFIAILIGHHRLTMRQRGILPIIDQAQSFLKQYAFFSDEARIHEKADRKNTYRGLTMTLPTDDPSRSIVVTLGSLIAQEAGIIGRSTCVFQGESEEWPDKQLVVKMSWPNKDRTSEAAFLKAAKAAAEKAAEPGKRHWVLDHLPDLLYSHDFATEEDSAEARIAELLEDGVFAGGKEFAYEQRALRLTIQELLFPLKTLSSAKDVAKVFSDAIQCHGWLYECPQILHRDISMSNIMYRVKPNGCICGVLNDFDLASFLWELADDASSTSLQRTGTPPFMAIDLLVGEYQTAPKHLYRHDLESFFYVMLVFAAHYELFSPPEAKRKTVSKVPSPQIRMRTVQPLSKWFASTTDLSLLRKEKDKFFANESTESMSSYVSPSFQALVPWLEEIRNMFGKGFFARQAYNRKVADHKLQAARVARRAHMLKAAGVAPSTEETLAPFDEVSLEQKVSYVDFMSEVEMLVFDSEEALSLTYFGSLP